MSIKQVIGAFLNMVFRLAISCFIVVAVYRIAMYSYHFGYMVFNDAAKEVSPGRDITISVEMDDSVMDIGQTLESRGLVEDGRIFFVQERLSEYHEMIKPGVYTLNTSMKPSELIAAMAAVTDEEEEEEDDLLTNQELELTDSMLENSDVAPTDENGDPIIEETGEDAEGQDD